MQLKEILTWMTHDGAKHDNTDRVRCDCYEMFRVPLRLNDILKFHRYSRRKGACGHLILCRRHCYRFKSTGKEVKFPGSETGWWT